MKLMQTLLSQAEGGAETYFEKVAADLAMNSDLKQRLTSKPNDRRKAA